MIAEEKELAKDLVRSFYYKPMNENRKFFVRPTHEDLEADLNAIVEYSNHPREQMEVLCEANGIPTPIGIALLNHGVDPVLILEELIEEQDERDAEARADYMDERRDYMEMQGS